MWLLFILAVHATAMPKVCRVVLKADSGATITRTPEHIERDYGPLNPRYARDKKGFEDMRKAATAKLAVAEVIAHDDTKGVLKVRDIPGDNMKKVLDDLLDGTDAKKYDAAVKDLNARLAELVGNLRTQGLRVERGPADDYFPGLHTYIVRMDTEIVDVGLPSNIVYDAATGRMTIVDPY